MDKVTLWKEGGRLKCFASELGFNIRIILTDSGMFLSCRFVNIAVDVDEEHNLLARPSFSHGLSQVGEHVRH